jgi:hypothetical protein
VSRPIRIPAYRKHSRSGQAVVTVTGVGGRSDIYLGPWGSPQSHREYVRVIAEWTSTVAGPPRTGEYLIRALSVNELILKFWDHAQRTSAEDGTVRGPSSPVGAVRVRMDRPHVGTPAYRTAIGPCFDTMPQTAHPEARSHKKEHHAPSDPRRLSAGGPPAPADRVRRFPPPRLCGQEWAPLLGHTNRGLDIALNPNAQPSITVNKNGTRRNDGCVG